MGPSGCADADTAEPRNHHAQGHHAQGHAALELFRPAFARLVSLVQGRVKFPEDWRELDREERSDFKAARQAIGDTLVDAAGVLQIPLYVPPLDFGCVPPWLQVKRPLGLKPAVWIRSTWPSCIGWSIRQQQGTVTMPAALQHDQCMG